MRRAEAIKRQARKPTDLDLPEDLADVCIGDGVERYNKMRELERKLDAAMMAKRLQIQEGFPGNKYREGVMRVWISNTAEGQPWQVMEEGGESFGADGTFDFGDNSHARYRCKIHGRLLPDPEDELIQEELASLRGNKEDDGDAATEKKKKTMMPLPGEKTRLSHFFKSITIEFDRPASLQPDGFSTIEWKKPTQANPSTQAQGANDNNAADFDDLIFERKSDEDMNVTINFVRDESPERFTLSPELADLLDTAEDTRAGVVEGIWEYIRAFGLQEDEENRRIVCDESLKKVFKTESLYFPYIPDQILPHLTPLKPIKLPYTIRVDKAYLSPPADSKIAASQATVYDIRVQVPTALQRQMRAIHSSPSHLANLKKINQINDDLALMIQKIKHLHAKHKFQEGLAKDPAGFIKRWTSSQERDLEIILAEGGRGFGDEGYVSEEFRRGGEDGVWGGPLAKESVALWLARQKAAQ